MLFNWGSSSSKPSRAARTTLANKPKMQQLQRQQVQKRQYYKDLADQGLSFDKDGVPRLAPAQGSQALQTQPGMTMHLAGRNAGRHGRLAVGIGAPSHAGLQLGGGPQIAAHPVNAPMFQHPNLAGSFAVAAAIGATAVGALYYKSRPDPEPARPSMPEMTDAEWNGIIRINAAVMHAAMATYDKEHGVHGK